MFWSQDPSEEFLDAVFQRIYKIQKKRSPVGPLRTRPYKWWQRHNLQTLSVYLDSPPYNHCFYELWVVMVIGSRLKCGVLMKDL